MRFKDAVDINGIKSYAGQISDSVRGIEDFGHCVGRTEECSKMKLRSDKLKETLKSVVKELDEWHTEMQDWYGN